MHQHDPQLRGLLVRADAEHAADPSAVRDWLGFLDEVSTQADDVDRTLLLAVLRGCLLYLLATGDVVRTSAAVDRYLDLVDERSAVGGCR